MRILGFLLLVFLVGFGLWSTFGYQMNVLISPGSALGVWGCAAALLMLSHGGRCWLFFWRFVRGRGGELSEAEREALGEFFLTGSRSALGMGLFWHLCGMMVMLMNMDSPWTVGPGMAMSILLLVYGVVLSEMVFMPLHKNLMQTLPREKRRSMGKAGLYLVILVNLLVMTRFLIMVLAVRDFY